MANTVSVIHPGQANGANATDALWLKQYGGQVFTAFETYQVTKDKHFVQSISGGESAQFPVTGRTTATYHTPGEQVSGNSKPYAAERVITVDGLLQTSVFVPEIEKLKTHFDLMSVYSNEAGQALAQRFDKNVLQTMVLAARASTTVTGEAGGTRITAATIGSDASVLTAKLFCAAQTFDEKCIPQEGKNCFVKPSTYYLLSQYRDLQNTLYKGGASITTGDIYQVAGINIVKTNNLPTAALDTDANITAAGDDPTAILAKYRGDFSTTVGVIAHSSAVGTLTLKNITSESTWLPTHYATLLTSRVAVGHGILRPESAIELASA